MRSRTAVRRWITVAMSVAVVAALVNPGPVGARPTSVRDKRSPMRAITTSIGTRAQTAGLRRLVPQRSLYSVVSPPLRTLRPRPVSFDRRTTEPVLPTALGDRASVSAPLSAVRAGAFVATAPAPSSSFDGMAGTGLGTPPDTTGEAGPSHFVQATNEGFEIFDKSGTVLYGPAGIETLWSGIGDSCELNGEGDPIVQYDQLADRWLISQFAFDLTARGEPVGPFLECIAVSVSGDPLGEYFRYSFIVSDSTFPDFPKFGVWPDGYYMTTHLFDPATGFYQGLGVIAFDRADMLAGRPADMQPFASTRPSFFGMLPSDIDGMRPPALGMPNFLVSVDDARNKIQVFYFFVDWVRPAASVIAGPIDLNVTAFDTNMCNGNPSCIPQPATTTKLDALADGIVMYRLAYRNFEDHESLILNHTVDVTGDNVAGIRWYELTNLAETPVINQQATYSPDDVHRWMGSMAQDGAGNMALGFSAASAQVFPSIRYAGRLSSDPLSTMGQGETTLMAGGGSQTGSNRWGDYSHMSIDPADDCTFWYTNEYYSTTSPVGWLTRIGSFRFPSCTATPPERDTVAPGVTDVFDQPDPFTPNGDGRKDKTKIHFSTSEVAMVGIVITRRNGAVVKELYFNVLDPGDWFDTWNGKNTRGDRVRSGTYVYVIEARDAAGNTTTVPGTTTVKR